MDAKRCKQLKQSGGFSLVELMIATVIVTAGLVTILGSMLSMNEQQRYADQEALSSIYMTFILEDLQEHIEQSGNIANVTNYSTGPFGNLFVDDDSIVDAFIPGLGPVRLQTVLGAAGSTIDTVEVQVIVQVRDHKARWIRYTTSKLISY